MKNQRTAENLIQQLLANPQNFDEAGTAYQLLQYYFRGFQVETLRPLLAHPDIYVRRSAVFIASELGAEAQNIVQDVVPLIQESDPYMQLDALDTVMVCSEGKHVDLFIYVLRELENDNPSLRRSVMSLVSNASTTQLETALNLRCSLGESAKIHERGLMALLNPDVGIFARVLDDPDPLIRKYGAIGAKRVIDSDPWLLQRAVDSADADIQDFSEHELKIFSIRRSQ